MGTYIESIESLDIDHSAQFDEKYQLAKSKLANVHTQNLEGIDRARPSQLQSTLEDLNTDFIQKLEAEKTSISKRKGELAKKRSKYLMIEWGLIIVGFVIALFDGAAREIGSTVCAAGVVCAFVFKAITDGAAKALAAEWAGFFEPYIAKFGNEETLHEPATGLYKEIDDLYLDSMTEQERGFEKQNRQMNRQMAASAEQAAQAQALATAQMEQLKEMNDAQKAVFGKK